jgi:small subunit ribosomal protein S5
MPNETETTETIVADQPVAEAAVVAATPAASTGERKPFGGRAAGGSRDRRGAPGGNRGPRRGGNDRERSEFSEKLIGIRRVARVMAGGRRFNFSVAIVLGDKKGRVGVGMGKAADTQLAIEKAKRDAKRKMITVHLTKNRSIKHNVEAKYCASVIGIRPSPGRGLVAGSSVRNVLELAGVSDVTAKVLSRSKNSVNNARAAIEALKSTSKGTASNK